MELKETQKKLIDAVTLIIEKEGFDKLGVNKIARTAGCDKVLIYRYFGGLDGLLQVWLERFDFYSGTFDRFVNEIEKNPEGSYRNLTKRMLIEQLNFLRENKMMQHLLLWELGNGEFTRFRDIRENRGNKIQKLVESKMQISGDGRDVAMQITILVSAINFIVLFTRNYQLINGNDFSDDNTWTLFGKMIESFVDSIFDKIEK